MVFLLLADVKVVVFADKFLCIPCVGRNLNRAVVALAMKCSRFKSIFIADCGDPFYVNPSCTMAFYLKWLEKYFLGKFSHNNPPKI